MQGNHCIKFMGYVPLHRGGGVNSVVLLFFILKFRVTLHLNLFFLAILTYLKCPFQSILVQMIYDLKKKSLKVYLTKFDIKIIQLQFFPQA